MEQKAYRMQRMCVLDLNIWKINKRWSAWPCRIEFEKKKYSNYRKTDKFNLSSNGNYSVRTQYESQFEGSHVAFTKTQVTDNNWVIIRLKRIQIPDFELFYMEFGNYRAEKKYMEIIQFVYKFFWASKLEWCKSL